MFAKPSFFTKTLERCPERGEHRLERERGRERERERERKCREREAGLSWLLLARDVMRVNVMCV